MTKVFNICLCGNVSAGKTTLCNSLIGKRISETGINRTTLKPKYYGRESIFSENVDFYKCELISDDNIKYNLMDFPGMNDIEDQGKKFDEQTLAYITNFDIILWISDSSTCFNTTYEKKQFDKIIDILNKNSIETGTLYQYGIILTKYDSCINVDNEYDIQDDNFDEIVTSNEESNRDDKYNFVKKLYPEIQISKFNAHGRIIYKTGSNQLKLLIKNLNTNPSDNNIEFHLEWATNNYDMKVVNVIKKSIDNKIKNIIKIDNKRYIKYFVDSTLKLKIIEILNKYDGKYDLNDYVISCMEKLYKQICENEEKKFLRYTFMLYYFNFMSLNITAKINTGDITMKILDDVLNYHDDSCVPKCSRCIRKWDYIRGVVNNIEYCDAHLRNEKYKLHICDETGNNYFYVIPGYYLRNSKESMPYINYPKELDVDRLVTTRHYYTLSLCTKIKEIRINLHGEQENDINVQEIMRLQMEYYNGKIKKFLNSVLSEIII